MVRWAINGKSSVKVLLMKSTLGLLNHENLSQSTTDDKSKKVVFGNLRK
jgi:hypothetical protein